MSILYFPLLLKEEVIGIFIVGTTSQTRLFTGNEIDLCYVLSFQVSLAIDNALLYKKAQQSITDLTGLMTQHLKDGLVYLICGTM